MMRPLRYSINVTLDGCCDHRAIPADEELHRRAVETLNPTRVKLTVEVPAEDYAKDLEAAYRQNAGIVAPKLVVVLGKSPSSPCDFDDGQAYYCGDTIYMDAKVDITTYQEDPDWARAWMALAVSKSGDPKLMIW